MSAQAPYLQRRGFGFTFRLAVPPDLRQIVGCREITKALPVTSKAEAVPQALTYAARFKSSFTNLRRAMHEKDSDKQKFVVAKMEVMREKLRSEIERDGLIDAHADEVAALQQLHRQELERLLSGYEALRREQEAYKQGVAAMAGVSSTPLEATPLIIEAEIVPRSPMLSAVIADYIAGYPADKSEMLKKHNVVLPDFLAIIGDKPVSAIRQADIKGFFATINALPPYATRDAKKRGISLREFAELDHPEVISKSTFLNTYKSSVRPFIKTCRNELHDQGFPPGLHTNYFYEGKDGPRKTQRAFKPEELKRLFEGSELKGFASNPKLAHQFWLPVIGLYTGARVNEICQINPQADLQTDVTTGFPYILISEDTEAAEGIEKSVKTEKARKVPLHPHLIDLGFPEYVAALKASGAKQLFPAWSPRGGRAAPNAIDWFGNFLKEIALYGVENENGCILLGMHAFRHTLLSYGRKQQLNLTPISGHAKSEEGFSAVAEGYVDDTVVNDMETKQALLARLDYGLSIPKPVTL